MKNKLTPKVIADLRPREVAYHLWDTEVQGFGVRVNARNKVYVARYRVPGGKQAWAVLGPVDDLVLKLSEARLKARELTGLAAGGTDLAGSLRAAARPSEVKLFSQLCDLFLEEYSRVHKASWKNDRQMINANLKPSLGDKRVDQIRRSDVAHLVRDVALKAPIQANRLGSCVSKIYNWAMSHRDYEDIIQFNPAQRIGVKQKESSRERVLTEQEIKRLWLATEDAQPYVRSFIRLRLLTLQRGAELLRMDVKQMNGQWWTQPAEITKTGQLHRVWLSELANIEYGRIKPSAGVVFRSLKPRYPYWTAPPKSIKPILEAAKLHNVQMKDLRRTAATFISSRRICDRFMLRKLLNHKEPGVTHVYDRFEYDDQKKAAFEDWSDAVRDMVK